MAVNIGPQIGLNGEAAYTKSLKNIIAQSKALQAEMKAVTSAFDANDSSQKKLESQINVLNKQIETQQQRVKLLGDAYTQSSDKVDKLNQELQDAVSKYGATSTEAQKAANALDKQQQAAQRARTEYLNATTALNKMTSELGSLTSETNQVASPMERLTDTIAQQQRELEQLQSEYSNAVLEFGKGSSSAQRLAREIDSLSGDLQENQKRADDATYQIDDLGDSFDDAGDKAASFGDIIGGTFLGNVLSDLASNAAQAIGELAGEALDASDSLLKFESTMDFAGFDSSTIEQTSAAMQQYAAETVYDLETVSNTVAQLGANGVDNFEALTEAAGNLNAVAGGNADTFQSVAMVLTQTAGAGKLTTENWNQLTDAIPGASGVLQQAMLDAGAYTGNFREAMENGEISAEEFNAAIMQLGSSDEAVKAAQSVSTIEGAVGNLQATFTDFIASLLTDAGGMGVITSGINSLAQGFQDLFSHIDTSSLSAAFSSFLAYLPTLVPQMMAQGVSLLQALGQGIVSAVPQLFQAAVGVVQGLTGYLAENLPQLIAAGLQSLLTFSQGLNEGVGNLVDSAIEMIMTLADGLIASLPVLIETVPTIVSNIANTINENAPKLLLAAAELIKKLAVGLVSNIPVLLSNLPQIIMAIADTITAFNWLNLGSQIIKAIGNGLASAAGFLSEMGSKTIRQLIDTVKSAVSQLPKLALQWGKDMITGFVQGITSSVGSIINAVKNIGSVIASYLHFSRPDEGPLRQYESWMPDFVKGMARGIEDNAWRIDDALAGVSNMMVFRPQAYAAQPAAAAAGTGSVYAGQPISITVNAAPGQDEKYIAELVMQKIQAATARKEATWGR